ncbi:class I SAM-dependent methyltransferase [Rhodococcus sp. MTM3W5.2]|uniref:class I SAM-dependent methyltransferase n=1 Tax=Rhodococcus sp. MTM3W5.2 TaxID=1805827 RepID=UPI0011AE1DF5|nr:class I SAM-dependent methyltransferase [Rhodococcus sp. MTM3W5.2]
MRNYAQSVLGHDMPDELQRLRLLESFTDPVTLPILESLDVGSTWRCLDVGAGAGSVARSLASSAADGSVVATDVDVRFLPTDIHNLKPAAHDIVIDDFPHASFDLVHSRLVLEYLPARDEILRRMAGWLAPGGWLCLGSLDISEGLSSPFPPVRAAMTSLAAAMRAHLGADIGYGRRATGTMRELGLRDVTLTGTPFVLGDGGTGDQFFGAMLNRFQPLLRASGHTSAADDMAKGIEWLAQPSGIDFGGILMTTFGRR